MELTLRELNRTLLARQLLLERVKLPVPRAVERGGPLQAQYTPSPYVALWSRLEGFEKAQLTRALERGSVLRSSVVRGTLHVTTRADFPHFASAYVEPQLRRARRLNIDVEKLRSEIGDEPLPPAELRTRAARAIGDDDRWTVAFALRALPSTTLPPAGIWGNHRGGPEALWRAALPPPERGTEFAVRRYLAAFGPATQTDIEHFLGLPVAQLKPALEQMRSIEIDGRVHFDAPRGRFAPADAPAPPRFLHSFDSLYLAHADKSRVVAAEHEHVVYRKKNATMRPIFLVDGFVAGTWTVERTRQKATLTVSPFAPLPPTARRELVEEGGRLVRWYEDAPAYAVNVAAPA